MLDVMSFKVDRIGATVSNLRWGETNVLFPKQFIGQKLRGGIPICIPQLGPTPDVPGLRQLPQHGFVRDLFCHDFTSEQNGAQSTAQYAFGVSDFFGWSFDLAVVNTLQGNGMSQTTEITNKSKKEAVEDGMPLCQGAHPYFDVTGGAKLTIGEQTWDVIEGKPIAPYVVPVPRDNQEAIIDVAHGRIRVVPGLTFSNGVFMVWTDGLGPYVCVELIIRDWKFFGQEGGFFLPAGGILKTSWEIIYEPK